MAQKLEDLITRVNKCKGEYVYALRKREEDIQAAVRALSSITDEDVEALSGVVPNLKIIKGYTVQQLSENLHDEIATVQETVQTLKRYVEGRLDYLESQL